ncbi:MAG: hypothetical protein ABSH28_07770 [Acidobacteriota bacterium]
MITRVICSVLLLLPFRQTHADAGQREFSSGYAGILPMDAKNLARTYFSEPAVRRLIFDLEKGPLQLERAAEVLKGTHFTVDDLLRVKLVSERDGRLFIGFNYFNADDIKAIDRVAALYVPSLVHAYLDQQQAFERIFKTYSAGTVSSKKLAFVLIAGFSLNWDGLRTTQELGYRKPLLVQGEGWRYSFWAEEDVTDRSTKEFYWGSSTFPAGKYNFSNKPADFAFSSFGDPFSDPRMNFPDLLYTSAADMAPAVRDVAQKIGLVHETAFGADFQNVLGFERARDLAALLFALRASPEAEARLARSIREPEKIGAYLSLLKQIQYVERGKDERYRLLFPVLDRMDKKLVDQSLALSRQIFSEWLKTNYGKMREDLGALTAMKQGVPFESLFTQIWHEWFGLTTRQLVRAGFMFDPYSKDATYKGSFPALWRLSLYDINQFD